MLPSSSVADDLSLSTAIAAKKAPYEDDCMTVEDHTDEVYSCHEASSGDNQDADHRDSSSECDDDDLVPEIWELDSDSEFTKSDSQQSTIVHGFLHTMSFLLLFFQLCYHVCDRGLHLILNIVSSIFHWVVCPGNDAIKHVITGFPKTIYSLKKFIGIRSAFDKFCVCPKCDSLYDVERCIVNSGTHQVS